MALTALITGSCRISPTSKPPAGHKGRRNLHQRSVNRSRSFNCCRQRLCGIERQCMLKLSSCTIYRLCGPRDSTSLRTFSSATKSRRRSARLSHRHLLQLACSFNGIEIELADFGVGIAKFRVYSGVTTMSCSSGTSLSRLLFS